MNLVRTNGHRNRGPESYPSVVDGNCNASQAHKTVLSFELVSITRSIDDDSILDCGNDLISVFGTSSGSRAAFLVD